MDKRVKQTILIVAFGIVLYAALMNLQVFSDILSSILNIFLPIILGLVIAFVLNVPVNGFEKLLSWLCKKLKWSVKKDTLHKVSFFLTVITIGLIVYATFALLIPRLMESFYGIIELVRENWPVWMEFLREQNIDPSIITEKFAEIDIMESAIPTKLTQILSTVAGAAFSTVSGVVTFILSFIIAVYVLLSRDTLAQQTKKILYANLKYATANKLCHIGKLAKDSYAKFLSGQCIEAIILGILIFIAYTLFGLPYAEIIAIFTAFCAFIPYIGAFVSCIVGAFLVLLVSPEKVILAVAVYMIVQFVENQFIYPHVVGNSVGLSPLWTLVAALLGGNLFGLAGIIFFIPLTAVIYTLVRENTNRKLKEKNLDL